MLDAYELWMLAEKEAEMRVFTKTGGVDISQRNNKQIKQLLQSAEKHNVPTTIMTPFQVKEKFPSVTIPDDCIGVYSPDSGILNATKAVAMFQHLAKMNGCIVKDNTSVVNIRQVTTGTTVEIIVETNKGSIFKCARCVVTVGSWTTKLLNKVNLNLPLRVVQTTVAYWPVENPSVYSSTVFPVFINYSDDAFVYGFPAHEFPNMIKCCAHFGPDVDPDSRDFLPGMNDLNEIVAPFIKRTLQGVSTIPEKTDSCMYTWTPDEDFIIDELPGLPGIFVGCGFSGHGFKLAPVVGRILSDLAMGRPHPYPRIQSVFSIKRFINKCKI